MNKKLQRILLVFVMGAFFANGAFAQGMVKAKGEVYPLAGELTAPRDNNVNKQDYSNWKYPIDALQLVGTLNRYVSFLFEDSTVVWVPDPSSGGTDYFYPWHSVGATFDPTDVNLEVVDDGIRLDRWHSYTIDSVYMPYIYVRYTDSIDLGAGNVEVVDTLIFQFFNYNQLDFGGFTNSQTNQSEVYAKPASWNTTKLANNSSVYEVKIPLTSLDSTAPPTSTGWLSKLRYFPVPDVVIPQDANLQGRRVCGFSITFKTMLPFEYGDTMEARDGSVPAKRLNYFGHTMYLNEGTPLVQDEYYNNSWWVPSEIRYGESLNGWTNNIPGNAYFQNRYLYYAIHVKDATIGVEELNNDVAFAVYPNPVSRTQVLKLDYALRSAQDVEIVLYDLMGNAVKTVASGYQTAGEHLVDLDVSDLPAGVYVYSVRAGNASTSKKITITE
ncbi:T9SS type A sorting domain-containing protein [bacterium]|nr:T9SS type A sorting domain-containing protein [bacterium]